MGLDEGRNVFSAAAGVKSNLVQSVNRSQWTPEQHANYLAARAKVGEVNSRNSLLKFRARDVAVGGDAGYWRGQFSSLDAVLHMASADQQKNRLSIKCKSLNAWTCPSCERMTFGNRNLSHRCSLDAEFIKAAPAGLISSHLLIPGDVFGVLVGDHLERLHADIESSDLLEWVSAAEFLTATDLATVGPLTSDVPLLLLRTDTAADRRQEFGRWQALNVLVQHHHQGSEYDYIFPTPTGLGVQHGKIPPILFETIVGRRPQHRIHVYRCHGCNQHSFGARPLRGRSAQFQCPRAIAHNNVSGPSLRPIHTPTSLMELPLQLIRRFLHATYFVTDGMLKNPIRSDLDNGLAYHL